MIPDQQLEAFRTALARWVSEVVALMVSNLDRYMVQDRDERWQLFPDGYYRRVTVDVLGWNLLGWPNRDVAAELQELEAYKQLLQVAEQTPPLDGMFGQLVGNAIQRSTFDFFAAIALQTLPAPALVAHGEPYSVDALCQQTIERILATEWHFTTIVYLHGLSLAVDRLELEKGVTLERLSPNDVIAGLRNGMLVTTFGLDLPIFVPEDRSAFAMKQYWSLPRLVGEAADGQAHGQTVDPPDTRPLVNRLLESLALITDKHIVAVGALTPLHTPDVFVTGEGYLGYAFPGPRASQDGFHLDEPTCAQLQELWVRPSDNTSQGKALELSIRRLSFATQRQRWDDRLLDLFVAAEAFYLSDLGNTKDRGELNYRLALRAAVWSAVSIPDWTPRQVLEHMKVGYKLRSIIVHGSTPATKDIKLKGEQVDLKIFVAATEEILRTALHKALAEVATTGRLAIKWDDLILPE